MALNLNSGYGQLIANRITNNVAGKVFLVAAAGVAYRDIYAEIFVTDPDGVARVFTTIDAAVGACTANSGDTIVVVPGHTETISSSTALNLDVAGINVVGLGNGTARPTITLATATSATINVSAANVRVSNMNFRTNLANIAALFTVSAVGFTLENCDIGPSTEASTSLGFLSIVTTSTTDSACNNLVVRNNKWVDMVASVNSCFIKQNGSAFNWIISGNLIRLGVQNNYPALIAQATGKPNQNGLIERNNVYRLNTDSATGALLITTDVSTNRSILRDNCVQHLDTAGELLITASSGYGVFNNLASGVQGASGYLLPAADA